MFSRFKFTHLTTTEQLPCTQYCSGFTGAYIPKEGERPQAANTQIREDNFRVVNAVTKAVKHEYKAERDWRGWAGALCPES